MIPQLVCLFLTPQGWHEFLQHMRAALGSKTGLPLIEVFREGASFSLLLLENTCCILLQQVALLTT